MIFDQIARFQITHMSYGRWLGEWINGLFMVSVMTGLISVLSDLGLSRSDTTILLLIVTFTVNVSWGFIDGLITIYGGLVDTADQEEHIGRLKGDRTNEELRSGLIDSLESSPVKYLSDEEKERITDQVILKAPEAKKRYNFTKDDRNTLIATASCDILAVIPVILPFLLLGFGRVPLLISRAIAAFAIGYIAYLFAEHTGRSKYLAAGIFIILTLVIMSLTYYIGW